ncbi:MAG TPA: hypothetical protein VFX02_13685 [Gammaproteobacteria bacterium]|nr:hypothetical protein [Gammaproteobacteria bacterium]
MARYRFVFFIVCLFPGAAAHAVDPGLDWYTLESAHFLIHFPGGAESLAQRTAAIAEEVHAGLSPLIGRAGWQPRDKTEIALSDEVDSPNGLTTPVPYNRSLLYIAPPRELDSLEDFDDWLKLLITHEYAHILHLDKVSGFWSGARSVFGRFPLFFPNLFEPAWLIEGYATYHESDEDNGRAQSSFFNMIMRTEVANGLKPLSQVSLPIREWPAGHTRYAYGVHFFEFVKARYGEEAMRRQIDRYSGNLIPFRLNGVSSRVYGIGIKDLWAQYEAYLNARYRPQLDAVRQQGEVAGRALTAEGFHLDSPQHGDGGVYYVQNTGYARTKIMHYAADGEPETVAEVHNGARIDFNPQAGLLVTQPEICDDYNLYSDIYRIAPGKHRLRRLTTCGRYVFATWNSRGDRIAAVHDKLGGSELHLLDADGRKLDVLWSSDTREILSYLDWSPVDDSMVAALWHDGRWDLQLFDAATRRWTALTADDDIQSQPSFTADGKHIVYTSERGGIYNIWLYDIASGEHTKLTNVAGGAFDPAYDGQDGVLYYSGYGKDGYNLYLLEKPRALDHQTAQAAAVARRTAPAAAAAEPVADAVPAELPVRDYSPFPSLRPRWWLPVLGYYAEGYVVGVTTDGVDALDIHRYSASIAYEEPLDSLSGSIAYSYSDRLALALIRDPDVDLIDDGDDEPSNDPVARARAHDIFEAIYRIPFSRYESRTDLLFYAGRDRTHDLEDVQLLPPGPDTEDKLLGAGLVFNSSRIFPFSVSPEDGRQVRLVYEDSDTLGGDFSGDVYTLDWREFISLGARNVAALRIAEGWGTDHPAPFELGGEEGVLDRDNIFNRRNYALRGYPEGLAALRGRRMRLGSAEWRFPIATVERTGTAPPVGILQISGSLFYETGAAWDEGSAPQEYFSSNGVEVSTEVVIGYMLPLDMHVGYARGQDAGGEDRWYLNIGASF